MDTSLFSLFVPILVFVFIALFKKSKKPKYVKAPAPSGAWPIIGHLHLLGGKEQLLYRTLGKMADHYGPAMSLQLGSNEAFVVSSFEVAKDCFTVNDKALASRPMTAAAKHMGYNFAVFGFAPYSAFWREMRKIATIELLSNRRLQMLKHVRVSEITMGVKDLYSLWFKNGGTKPVMVDLKSWLEDMTLNMIVRMVAGKRYFGGGGSVSSEDTEEAMQCKKAIAKFFHLIGIFTVSDAFPTLSFFDLQGHEKEMKQTGSELDVILERWIENHRQQRKFSGTKENDSDFIDVMMSLAEQGKLSHLQYDANTSIKSTCLKSKKPKYVKAPAPSGAWPIIGHLHLLGGKEQLLYRTLGKMADHYGPAMSLRLGSSETFVGSSFEVAKDCFTVNDKALASLMTAAAKHMGYVFWLEMRKIAMIELLSNRRLQMLNHVRVSEISMGVKDLYSLWVKKGGSEPVIVDLKSWLEDMIANMIMRMVAGKRYFGGGGAESSEHTEEARQWRKGIAKFFHLVGIFTVSDAFPKLGWLDLQGHEKEMKQTRRELDVILERWIENHRQQRKVSGTKHNDSDFVDVMLSLAEQGKLSHLQYDANTPVDMSESPGLTITKATPLEVLINPRLKRELFV
ncbi:unnamed protein product [Arabidopsis thaliana]|uniref:(thale cress) hypothetical protein n=1 Tax=Arabidopsis thaliana TaxID=3702 RepID=A0A7G2F589_ARATH|nr:unnamed protein product [Arabidopsis thaliana]